MFWLKQIQTAHFSAELRSLDRGLIAITSAYAPCSLYRRTGTSPRGRLTPQVSSWSGHETSDSSASKFHTYVFNFSRHSYLNSPWRSSTYAFSVTPTVLDSWWSLSGQLFCSALCAALGTDLSSRRSSWVNCHLLVSLHQGHSYMQEWITLAHSHSVHGVVEPVRHTKAF